MASSAGMAARSADLIATFMTNQQKLHRGIWPWIHGLKSRLPLHYKQRYVESCMREPKPVHYRADPRRYVLDKFGIPTSVQNVSIPVTFPKEADEGLWGGEGFVAGLTRIEYKSKKPSRNAPTIWKPELRQHLFYSEVLDKWMSIVVTRRTMELIDAAYGFDFYILKTHEVDLSSRLGMRLKQQMLMALARRTMHPENPEQQERILEKYKDFIIPEEEAEWVGLTLYEAERKQYEVEEAERLRNMRPLKDVYVDELAAEMAQIMAADTDKPGTLRSWINKLNPFQEKTDALPESK